MAAVVCPLIGRMFASAFTVIMITSVTTLVTWRSTSPLCASVVPIRVIAYLTPCIEPARRHLPGRAHTTICAVYAKLAMLDVCSGNIVRKTNVSVLIGGDAGRALPLVGERAASTVTARWDRRRPPPIGPAGWGRPARSGCVRRRSGDPAQPAAGPAGRGRRCR